MVSSISPAPDLWSGPVEPGAGPVELCSALRAPAGSALLLDGAGGFATPWLHGPLLAVDPLVWPAPPSAGDLIDAVDLRVRQRRRSGGAAETGLALALSYDGTRAVVMEVDRSLRFAAAGAAELTVRVAPAEAGRSAREVGRRVEDAIGARSVTGRSPEAARCTGPVRTSLPRESYLRSVQRVREAILDGEIYQANLCQRFAAAYRGDELALYGELALASPAPLSAFVATPELVLASVSPEVFIRVEPPDRISTHPIKGTRPRGRDAEEDRLRREELLASPKDRAELLMIVDLERNDLGRVCRTGTIEVRELATLRSYAHVHHLVARVEGRLEPSTGPAEWIGATFPGGSITGAPKIRAMEILETLEPVPRGFFTGSLFWFGDDGSTDSSILIRTLEFRQGQVFLGAGGGVVADSDPEEEWMESNHKAAALATALGFDPERAR